MKIKRLWNELARLLGNCNSELSKAIGKKSVYGHIDIENDFLESQWINFHYSEALSEEEKKKVIKILTKYFGELDRPDFSMNFKTERRVEGGLRWNTYVFMSYLKSYKGIQERFLKSKEDESHG